MLIYSLVDASAASLCCFKVSKVERNTASLALETDRSPLNEEVSLSNHQFANMEASNRETNPMRPIFCRSTFIRLGPLDGQFKVFVVHQFPETLVGGRAGQHSFLVVKVAMLFTEDNAPFYV